MTTLFHRQDRDDPAPQGGLHRGQVESMNWAEAMLTMLCVAAFYSAVGYGLLTNFYL